MYLLDGLDVDLEVRGGHLRRDVRAAGEVDERPDLVENVDSGNVAVALFARGGERVVGLCQDSVLT
jgi:hypothetical protein